MDHELPNGRLHVCPLPVLNLPGVQDNRCVVAAMKFEKKTVYIYEINGQEKVKISSAAEAKKWDEIFATALRLDKVLKKSESGLKLVNGDSSELCIYLAKHRNEVLAALQGSGDRIEVPEPMSPSARRIEVPEPMIPSSKDGFSL